MAQSVSHILYHLLFASFSKTIWHLYFRHVRSECMLIFLRTTCFSAYSDHLRNLHQHLFRLQSYFVAHVERRARKRADIDCKRTFVERRKKIGSECEHRNNRCDESDTRKRENYSFAGKCPIEQFSISVFQTLRQPTLFLLTMFAICFAF